jgi:hypothetical protein
MIDQPHRGETVVVCYGPEAEQTRAEEANEEQKKQVLTEGGRKKKRCGRGSDNSKIGKAKGGGRT